MFESVELIVIVPVSDVQFWKHWVIAKTLLGIIRLLTSAREVQPLNVSIIFFTLAGKVGAVTNEVHPLNIAPIPHKLVQFLRSGAFIKDLQSWKAYVASSTPLALLISGATVIDVQPRNVSLRLVTVDGITREDISLSAEQP